MADYEQFPVTIDFADHPIVPGTTWPWTFSITDDNDTPINTTSYTLKMQFRDKPNGRLLAEISTANGKSVNTPAAGQFVQTLTPADTLKFDVNHAVWDCFVTDNLGSITPMFKGEIPVESPVTK